MRRRVMGWMGVGLILGLLVPAAGRAQTLGDTTAAMGTHSTLSGTSAGRPAATIGTVKSHVSSGSVSSRSEGWAKPGGQAAGGTGSRGSSRGWATSTERAGSGWAKAADQRSGAGWAKASDRRPGPSRH